MIFEKFKNSPLCPQSLTLTSANKIRFQSRGPFNRHTNHVQRCNRVCPADQGSTSSTDPSVVYEPLYSPDTHPDHHTFIWSLLTRVVIFLAVGMLVYLALRWKREWKETERRRALLPKVGYFCPRPPPPAAPTQQPGQQQQVPIQNSLYIIPPPYYGMAVANGGGGTAADSDTVEKEGVENLKFY